VQHHSQLSGNCDVCSLEPNAVAQLETPVTKGAILAGPRQDVGGGLIEIGSQQLVPLTGYPTLLIDRSGLVASWCKPNPGCGGPSRSKCLRIANRSYETQGSQISNTRNRHHQLASRVRPHNRADGTFVAGNLRSSGAPGLQQWTDDDGKICAGGQASDNSAFKGCPSSNDLEQAA